MNDKIERINIFVFIYRLEKKSEKMAKHAKEYLDASRGKLTAT
jgi:hypothetical protein